MAEADEKSIQPMAAVRMVRIKTMSQSKYPSKRGPSDGSIPKYVVSRETLEIAYVSREEEQTAPMQAGNNRLDWKFAR